ncbi:hypothetical protein [Terrabacter sp. Root181]|uniref:hypothetical protein n=1 Tax=Terrabacter sp. Root181 TaxID=1736484 RepID=UPI0006F32D25|nr:hypothetical protein [Terrabacter sp. Root181]KRB44269.1 hypothetical protein ASD90_17915 [Terrabacter sp. Root181]
MAPVCSECSAALPDIATPRTRITCSGPCRQRRSKRLRLVREDRLIVLLVALDRALDGATAPEDVASLRRQARSYLRTQNA